MSKNLKPLGDRIVVKPAEQAEKSSGGIFLPETAKDESQEGVVISVGPGRTLDDGKVMPVSVKAGDRIVYVKYGPNKLKIDGQELLILSEKDVLAVMTDAPVAVGV